jgi:universal stress protein E
MKKLKSICVAISDPFRTEQHAAIKAAAVAAKSGASLTLLNTFWLPQPMPEVPVGDTKRLMAAAIRQRKERLNALAKKLGRNVLKVRCEVRWDYPPHEAIVRYVLETKPDLLFADSHRHNRLVRLVLANTDWELIRNCPCPLWFVRSPKLPKRLNLLVAVDPAHSRAKPARLDDYLLETARTVSDNLIGNLDVIHAYLQPHKVVLAPAVGPISVPLAPEALRLNYERLKKSVDMLAEKYDVPLTSRHIKAGLPQDALIAATSRLKTDVLVMGAVSRSGLDRLFIGSTAERVIDHVVCDVLVVKPAGLRTAIRRTRPKLPAL